MQTETKLWGDYGHNVYYDPEKCGLAVVEDTEEPGLSYEFHNVVLWRDTVTGKLWWAEDSGCSCPSPFEDVRSLSDLQDYEKTKDEYEARKKACVARDWS
jgi:hypothetical protein